MEQAKKLYDWLNAENYYVVGQDDNVVARIDTDYIGADVELDLGKTGWYIDNIELDYNCLDLDALDDLDYEIDRLKDNIRYYNENKLNK